MMISSSIVCWFGGRLVSVCLRFRCLFVGVVGLGGLGRLFRFVWFLLRC